MGSQCLNCIRPELLLLLLVLLLLTITATKNTLTAYINNQQIFLEHLFPSKSAKHFTVKSSICSQKKKIKAVGGGGGSAQYACKCAPTVKNH